MANAMTIIHGDCRTVLAAMDADSVDSIACDPPYGLGFMGKDWDHGVPGQHFWEEAYRVAKPGAYLVAFGGTRTHHRLMVAIEDAGWEIRDTLMWLYGSGFPKSLDVSKAIDKAAGAAREVVGRDEMRYARLKNQTDQYVDMPSSWQSRGRSVDVTAPATDAAEQWAGWGTALKPAWEPIILARKPLAGTVAQNVQTHGVGGLNIDGCRIALAPDEDVDKLNARSGGSRGFAVDGYVNGTSRPLPPGCDLSKGRWPANLLLDEQSARLLDAQTGDLGKSRGGNSTQINAGTGRYNWNAEGGPRATPDGVDPGYGDSGGPSRFFYCAKASKAERERGCADLPMATAGEMTGGRKEGSDGLNSPRAGAGRTSGSRNTHPTVKPIALMRWLVRLITPPGGLVLDPFAGSGTTGLACADEGFRFVGIELDEHYAALAAHRLGTPVGDDSSICRDCADFGPVCPHDGQPCEPVTAAPVEATDVDWLDAFLT